eukprot:g1792.t1
MSILRCRSRKIGGTLLRTRRSLVTSEREDRKVDIANTIPDFREARSKLADLNCSVGFVPTMGALHEGHLSLVRGARRDNDKVVASVFVNPTQFGPNEDLNTYPRDLERDVNLLTDAGVDLIFAPELDSMYGEDFSTYVHPKGYDETQEERCRPGFFRGVATVVTKLFNIVQPTRAYFGQKDAVQCSVIKRIVEDLNIQTNVVVMPTVRESDGLAMSSRNAYLDPSEREVAGILYKGLCDAEKVWQRFLDDEDGTDSIAPRTVQDVVLRTLESEKMVSEIQYVSVDDWRNMKPATSLRRSDSYVVSLAVTVGKVRLIDNTILRGPGN